MSFQIIFIFLSFSSSSSPPSSGVRSAEFSYSNRIFFVMSFLVVVSFPIFFLGDLTININSLLLCKLRLYSTVSVTV